MPWPFQVPARVWCLVTGHDPRLEHGRDAAGDPVWPPALHWVCVQCRADLGPCVLKVDGRRDVG